MRRPTNNHSTTSKNIRIPQGGKVTLALLRRRCFISRKTMIGREIAAHLQKKETRKGTS